MPQQKRPNILIVDGDENHRLLYRAYFNRSGYRVKTAATGLQAVAYIDRAKPDIIILDVDLPRKDGFDTLTTLHMKYPRVPIIINTGYPHFRTDVRCWDADAFMIKSSNIEELERTVKELLGKRNVTGDQFTLLDDYVGRTDMDVS